MQYWISSCTAVGRASRWSPLKYADAHLISRVPISVLTVTESGLVWPFSLFRVPLLWVLLPLLLRPLIRRSFFRGSLRGWRLHDVRRVCLAHCHCIPLLAQIQPQVAKLVGIFPPTRFRACQEPTSIPKTRWSI